MKAVVVGTNQKDRERVARVIKDKYKGLAEMNEGLRDNKRYLENDLALKMEQIVALREVGERLRDYLTESGGDERYSSVDIPDETWVPFIEALRGEEAR